MLSRRSVGQGTTGGWDGGSELEKGRGECQKAGGRGERNGGMCGMGKVEKDGDRRAERMGKKEGQVGKDAEGGLDRLESGVWTLESSCSCQRNVQAVQAAPFSCSTR